MAMLTLPKSWELLLATVACSAVSGCSDNGNKQQTEQVNASSPMPQPAQLEPVPAPKEPVPVAPPPPVDPIEPALPQPPADYGKIKPKLPPPEPTALTHYGLAGYEV